MHNQVLFLALPLALLACAASTTTYAPSPATSDASSIADTSSAQSASDGTPGGKAAQCTGVFGTAITAPFGRLDGTLMAVVTPADQQCPKPNNTHVVLEMQSMGARYRMVASMVSTKQPPDVLFTSVHHALVGPTFADGWHTGLALDYVTDLGLHSGDFTAVPKDALVKQVNDALTLGAHVSVYASTDRGGYSAHLVHRNGGNSDGAIVIDPESAGPTWLLFRFAEQAF